MRPVATALRQSAANSSTALAASLDALDWARIAAELDQHGCATTGVLLSRELCEALAALYQSDAIFRSRVVMARHGFGRGEYKYFAYPLPEPVAVLRTALYPALSVIANRWNETMGISCRSRELSRPLRRCRADQAHALAASIWSRRLQLLASGSLRRSCLSAANDSPPLTAAARFKRWRIRAHGAAAAHAVSRRGRAARSRRGRNLSRASPTRPRHARQLPREHASWRQPPSLGSPLHAGNHFSRCCVNWSMIPKSGNRFSEKDHAQTKS